MVFILMWEEPVAWELSEGSSTTESCVMEEHSPLSNVLPRGKIVSRSADIKSELTGGEGMWKLGVISNRATATASNRNCTVGLVAPLSNAEYLSYLRRHIFDFNVILTKR